MTITDKDKLESVSTDFQKIASDIFVKGAPGNFTVFTRVKPTSGKILEFNWLSNWPVMKEWVGNKSVDPTRANRIVIRAKNWEKTTSMDWVDFFGDSAQVIADQLSDWLNDATKDLDRLCTDKLLAGFTENGFDGVTYFSTAHPNGPGGGTISNRTNVALNAVNLNAAIAAMTSIRDENGEPVEVNPTHLVVGPNLYAMAKELLEADLRLKAVNDSNAEANTALDQAGAVSNIFKSYGIVPVLSKRFVGAYADYWVLVDNTKSTAPIMVGELKAPAPKDNLNDYNRQPFAEFSVEYHAGIDFGHWVLAYGSTGA